MQAKVEAVHRYQADTQKEIKVMAGAVLERLGDLKCDRGRSGELWRRSGKQQNGLSSPLCANWKMGGFWIFLVSPAVRGSRGNLGSQEGSWWLSEG